jgi:hypothetical protein
MSVTTKRPFISVSNRKALRIDRVNIAQYLPDLSSFFFGALLSVELFSDEGRGSHPW